MEGPGASAVLSSRLAHRTQRNPDPAEVAIQPDFIFVDSIGIGHICEVKLPLLEKSTLTTGHHRRRKFISAVSDGIAQLGNYLEYVSFPAHQELIAERYRIDISDPRLVLIVGSTENFDSTEVRKAQRMLRKFELIDYDSLRALFLATSGYRPTP